MKPPARHLVAIALTAPMALAGCSDTAGGDDSRSSTTVVASFYPLAYVASRVAGEHAEVVNLTSPGVEPHDLEMSIGQTAEVVDADLVVYEKGLQPAVDEAVEQSGREHVVEAADAVGVDGEDLHFWLDPMLMIALGEAVQTQLSDLDPDSAADFEANLEQIRGDLEELDEDYRAGLADCRLDTAVVSHDAFGFLEKYGLRFEPIAGLSPDAEPSPAHLSELAGLIEHEGVTTVFSESLASPAMADTLARDLDLETGVLDPIEGLSDATRDEDYLSLMRANLEALRAANRCR